MSKRFDGKVVLITGATSGIGRDAALAFAREGASVVANGRRQNLGDELVSEIKANGGNATFVAGDVTNEADIQKLVETAVSAYGGIDVAINNAGVETTGMITDVTEEEYRKVFDINVLGVFLGIKHEAPHLIKRGGGVIINLATIAGHKGFPGASVYAASKHAVLGVTRSAALEFASQGVRVVSVSPGGIDTDMLDRFAGKEGEMREGLIAKHPVGRIGKTKEIVDAFLFLASDDASFITGTDLAVDGGFLTA
ncbi:MAG: glucose 1-dehydrogenase [Planctomycetota bacterium]